MNFNSEKFDDLRNDFDYSQLGKHFSYLRIIMD